MRSLTIKDLFVTSMVFYLGLSVYHLFNDIYWLIDPVAAIAYLSLVYWKRDYLYIGRKEFLLFNIGILLHNIGFLGLYGWTNAGIGYDVIVHFVNSLIGGYLVMNFLRRRHLKKSNERKIAIALSVGFVLLFGMLIEFTEYMGFVKLGSNMTNIGILNVGSSETVGQYADTIKDIFVNIVSAWIGALIYRKR